MAKKDDTALAVAPEILPSTGYDWEQDAGIGQEDVKSTDLSLPIWRLLQSNSPECKRMDPAYVIDAAEGRWLDTLRREVCDSFLFVPCRYQTQVIRWKPRDSGGGMVRNYGLDDSVLKECEQDNVGRYHHPSGDEVIPTPTWYGLVMQTTFNGTPRDVPAFRAVLTFTGTQAKISRKWLNSAHALLIPGKNGALFRPPYYYLTYSIGSIGQSSEKGSWAVATVDRHGLTGNLWPDVVPLAKDFAELTKSQDVMDNVAQQMDDHRQSQKEDLPDDDKIPF